MGATNLVLVVDDDKVLADALLAELHSCGLSARCAASGGEGYELILQRKPDLVVLDIMMPDLDGLALLKKLRQHNSNYCQNLPVIILTNLTNPVALQQANALRCDQYIVKSNVSLAELSKLVESKLGSSK